METVLEALQLLLSGQHFLYLMVGVVVGLVVAILPGLGGTVGLALVLPFIYGMDQASALALMIGLLSVTCTGDTFPSVLMGIPGSSSSQATVCDGFPLAKKGQSARALGAAFSASLIGGLFGAVVLTLCLFAARPLIMSIGMGEQLLLVILALTMVGMLTGQNIAKGLAACGIGLLIGAMGAAPATGALRYDFDTIYLTDGIPLVVLALGIFAMPEIISLLRQTGAISQNGKLGSGMFEGIKDTWRSRWLVLRCSGLGVLVGMLPGLGGSVVDWMAYGHAMQTTKDNENFGKGDIRGVIAPESANNAKEGGALVPTLFFGIPGSGAMALLLGGFVLIGIQPGVRMVTQDLHLTYLVIWSLGIANIFGAGICMLLASKVSKLTTIPYGYIGPLMIVLIVFTAYQATNDWGDLLTLMVLTVFGIYMKRFGWSRPALVIGYVLSEGLEGAVYQTTQVYGLSFLERPQSLLILAVVILSIIAGLRLRKTSRAEKDDCSKAAVAVPRSRLPQLAFVLLLLGAVAYAGFSVQDTIMLTKLYPTTIAVITAVLLAVVLLQQCIKPLGHSSLEDDEQLPAPAGQTRGLLYFVGWTLAMLGLVWVFGYSIAAALFVVIFLTLEVRLSLWRSLTMGGGAVAVLALLAFGLALNYPQGILAEYVPLPYWLQ